MWSLKKAFVPTEFPSFDATGSVVIDTTNKNDFSIQVNYGSGTSTVAKLQCSNDGVNYVDVPDSAQTLGTGGGTHIWNISEFKELYIKVVITGDNVDNEVILASIPTV